MKFFTFLVQRTQDKEPWALIFTSRTRAEKYPSRVSELVEVELTVGYGTPQETPFPGSADDGSGESNG
jgi:hypothetical protein